MFLTESMGAHFILVSFHPVRLLIFAWMRDTPFFFRPPTYRDCRFAISNEVSGAKPECSMSLHIAREMTGYARRG